MDPGTVAFDIRHTTFLRHSSFVIRHSLHILSSEWEAAMGAGWYVALERGIPGTSGKLPHNGRALLFAQHHLEEFARDAGLPPLKDFFSSDPTAVAAYLHDQGIEADADEMSDESWFDAADALPTVRLCRERLADPPAGLGQVDRVGEDLAAMETILQAADQNGVRFHIATGLPDLSDRPAPDH
jgi:hypothetical protein